MKRDDALEPELQAFVTSRQVVRRAPPEVRARALLGARRIIAGERSVPAAPEPLRAAPPPVRVRVALRFALAASVVVAAGAVGAVMFVRGRAAQIVPPASSLPARPCPVRDDREAAATPTPTPTSSLEAEPTVTVARPHRAPGEADPFAAQLELLQRAQAAYTRRDFSSALSLLAEHARRFPRGHLAEEREALRVRSLLGAGRGEEARGAAAQFARRFPRSVLLPSLEDEQRAGE